MPLKKTLKKTKKSKAKSAKKTASPRKKTAKKKAVRKKTRGVVKKKSAARKRKTAKKSVKRTAAKKRTASSKKTARKKTAAGAAKKKKVAKTAKRKPAPKKKTAPKKKAALKPRRAPAKPRKKPGARMLKPKEDEVQLRTSKAYQIKKGEPYMNSQQLGHFNKLLLDWKKELMKEVDRTVDHMKSDATNFADPADRATQEEEFSLELRTRDRERKLIKKIDEALGMMEVDEYGYCSSCGAEIGVRRLEARPTATLCIDCKTMQEIKEKQVAD